MLLGALILVVVVAITHDRLPRDRSTWGHLSVAALVANAAPYLLFALGETRVDSSIAGVMNATTPLWTLALAAAIRPAESIRPTQIAAQNSGTIDPLGTFYCLLAAISYAISYVYMARYLTPKDITPTALAAAQLIAATGWTLLALAANPGAVPHFAPVPWAALAILGVFGTGLAYIINYALIRHEGPTRASVVTYLVPLVSVTLGATALSEPLTPGLLTGSALVLIGIALSRRHHPGWTGDRKTDHGQGEHHAGPKVKKRASNRSLGKPHYCNFRDSSNSPEHSVCTR